MPRPPTRSRPENPHATGGARLDGRAQAAARRRVAGLAAEGRTPRDIAQALFLTPRAVEVELASAARKLGLRSPDELPDALRAA